MCEEFPHSLLISYTVALTDMRVTGYSLLLFKNLHDFKILKLGGKIITSPKQDRKILRNVSLVRG